MIAAVVSEVKERFARDHGFDSYKALVEASAPLPTNDGANWFVDGPNLFLSVDSAGRWFAWNEATLEEAEDEAVLWRDTRPHDSPQSAPANAAHSQESEEDCMMALLAPLPKWQECDAVR